MFVFQLPVETIGSKFGGIPAGFPPSTFRTFRPELILLLLPSALTVAILAAVESLLSAVVADSMTGDRHNSNVELVAQGVANIVGPLFGGIPVTGAIARTATNFRSGAKTPVAGMIHALTLLAVILVLAPLAKFIPLATLAAVLFVVAYNMGEWREIAPILRLEAGGQLGLAHHLRADRDGRSDGRRRSRHGAGRAALHLPRLANHDRRHGHSRVHRRRPPAHSAGQGVSALRHVLRIHGPFLFGTTEKLMEETSDLSKFSPIVILRLRNMTAIDATGLHALERLSDRLKKSGRTLILCGARHQPAQFLRQAEFVEHIGRENIRPHVQAALDRAAEIERVRSAETGYSGGEMTDGKCCWGVLRLASPGRS